MVQRQKVAYTLLLYFKLEGPQLAAALPDSVRYVKNGPGGQWWKAAKANGQIHLGWRIIPDALLRMPDMGQIEGLIRAQFGKKPGATQDFKALQTLLVNPGQHV